MYKKVYLSILAALVISAIIVPGSNVLAEYPEKPITMLIGFRPGGAVDTTARLVAKNMEKILGQPVVGVTKAGGGGTIMATQLINAKADGYTIGMGASAAYTLTPQINKKIKYTIDGFDHLGTLTIPQDGLVVLKDSPWNTLEDMVKDAKASGKILSIASQVSVVDLLALAITHKTGVKFKVVPVKGGSRGIQAVLGGHVDLTWSGRNYEGAGLYRQQAKCRLSGPSDDARTRLRLYFHRHFYAVRPERSAKRCFGQTCRRDQSEHYARAVKTASFKDEACDRLSRTGSDNRVSSQTI